MIHHSATVFFLIGARDLRNKDLIADDNDSEDKQTMETVVVGEDQVSFL